MLSGLIVDYFRFRHTSDGQSTYVLSRAGDGSRFPATVVPRRGRKGFDPNDAGQPIRPKLVTIDELPGRRRSGFPEITDPLFLRLYQNFPISRLAKFVCFGWTPTSITSQRSRLRFSMNHLVPSGTLIVDDYRLYAGARKATDGYFARLEPPPC